MGQQQTMAEQQAGGALMRRILMVILVATLMALLMAASAMPATAKNFKFSDGGPPVLSGDITDKNSGSSVRHNSGETCVRHDGGKESGPCP
jgi:hypothetical protein